MGFVGGLGGSISSGARSGAGPLALRQAQHEREGLAETLSASRLEAHRALERELAHEATKVDKQAAAEAKDERRRFSRSIRSEAKKRRRLKEGR